nr:MAG TPA: hypothetical protein [Bacteriophage sp.]
MPNAKDVLDSMEQIDNLSIGDLVYVPEYGMGIVWRHHDHLEDIFDVAFGGETITYTKAGDEATFDKVSCTYSSIHDEELSVKRFAPIIGRRLAKGMQVYNFLYGVGTVVIASPPDDECIYGRAVSYFTSGDINKETCYNGQFLHDYGVNLANDVFPMDNFRPFAHSEQDIERAACEMSLKDLSKRYFEVLERYKKLGGDDSNYTL